VSAESIQYFSGFRGDDSLVVVTPQRAAVITDFRYTEQAQREALGYEVIKYETSLYDSAASLLQAESTKCAAFEGEHMRFNQYARLKASFKGELKPLALENLRAVKDSSELVKLKKAVAISDAAFSEALKIIQDGVSEIAVAAKLEEVMRRLGSERPAFATIVASGVRGSLPHGLASDKIIREGELVTMDFGAVYEGYHSDITRTVCVGRISDRQREIYNTVLNAQILGTKAVKAGVSGKSVDAAARKYITDAGYGRYFGHGLGHGVGLAIHEMPRLSPKGSDEPLKEGMAVTVEPGIYISGFGGVRIEDTVVVGADGCDILTAVSKQLIEISSSQE
jgi:Xaa-Pro aminopeptidase